ncbi:hypothetical protein AC241_32040 (plasmid) [Bacillus thuringiensis]|uniref:hypothetical protein n=1 Tax=Bacillus thuringiensis TaxID=1428 RepID=UPI000676BB19|nr:hypothetical protein [Bacillus thuringiensis]AKR13282.1 hypothetical protein AC241_32040 [Bacillus thuringiensis]
MNRKMSNLFPGSATRTTEDINKSEIQHPENNNETLTKQNDNVNNNVNETLKEQVNINIENDDILGFLKEEQEKKVVGFHLDKDVRQAFQKVLGKKPQRGAQSELANRIFRDFFEKRGLL